jgi:hypothetical protein
MSITKTQAVLAMYDDFLEDHQLTKSTFMANDGNQRYHLQTLHQRTPVLLRELCSPFRNSL